MSVRVPSNEQPAGVARVVLDVHLAHLDHFFDYAVPSGLDAQAVEGARVRVRFAGRPQDGYIVERADTSDVNEPLKPISKVVSPEPVLHPEQLSLIRAAADHYAGTMADLLRLAVPPRHAATEQAEQHDWPVPLLAELPTGGLLDYPAGGAFLNRLAAGEGRRAFWQVTPVSQTDATGEPDDWMRGFLQAAICTLRAGQGVLILVPDAGAVRELRDRFGAVLGLGCLAELHNNLGPAARYRNYLALSRSRARIVVGTRGAVWAPVPQLGLIALWDDGNDLYAEPRAPYPHARDVAAIRAAQQHAGLLVASHARTAEVAAWVRRDWLVPIERPGDTQRRIGPAVRVVGDSDLALERDPLARAARLPDLAFHTIRQGLLTGPVLVQVPRAGYLVALSCQECRTPVRCPTCHGPVRGVRDADGSRHLQCGWCGRLLTGWRCPVCGGQELRAPIVGSGRTAEELGRAFPGVRLVDSSGERVVPRVGDQPALVVATPGAEPVATHGYAAGVLMDAALLLGRQDLRAQEEALRRWCNAVALVRPGSDGGTICVVGPSEDRAVQALVRLDPAGFADRELDDRATARFPPAVKLITVDAAPGVLAGFRDLLHLPEHTELLGPVDLPVQAGDTPAEPEDRLQRLILRGPLSRGGELAVAVKAALAVRSARKDEGPVRVRVDPAVLA